MSQSRRALLKRGAGLLGVGATTAIAGCSDAVDQATGEFEEGYAAFFTLQDWTNRVAGDNAEFESPVEVGQMGHGFEPTGDLTAEVASTNAFVYLDTPEFSWAQDLARGLETDYDDITVIDGLVGLEDQFLDWDHDHDEDDHDEDDDYDLHVDTFEVIDREHDEVIADVDGDHWHGSLPVVEEKEYVSLGANAEDDHGDHIDLGEDEEYQLNARVADGADEIVTIESHGDHIHVTGEEHGHTELVFQLYHDDHADWESSPLALNVVHEDEADDHDQGFHDPHVWVDPVLAQDVVDNIADGLARADPDNAEEYFENADAYNAELDAVDDAFEEMMADAERDVAVLAGHDSFQYLEVRYGFELYSPVGVSPEDEPSQNDIADTIEFVNENDIDVVLYDHFGSPNLAETIVENSDATDTMSVSPTEGTTEEWNELDYGYVDQMLEVNVPSFRRALGAE